MKSLFLFYLTSLLFISSCAVQVENKANSFSTDEKALIEAPEKYRKMIRAIEPFFEEMPPPKSDDWLATFHENGQTFEQYLNEQPNLPTAERRILYIQPLGVFNSEQIKIVKLTAEFMQIFFSLPVKILPVTKFEKPLRLKNRRLNPSTKNEQIRTEYILDEILTPNLPQDAAALIAFTNEDLFPDSNFSFVFGQASFENHVGVWSLYRLKDAADKQTFLMRTIKLAIHETGHLFSLRHCTKYQCVMNGANHLGETDRHPIDACPECTAKICWLSSANPAQRYLRLADFCRKNGMKKDYQSYLQKAQAVK